MLFSRVAIRQLYQSVLLQSRKEGELSGWIKLHRQTIENEVFKYDPTAWRVFEALMFLCDYETGEWRGGRFRLAEHCHMNPNTMWSATDRLIKAGMINRSSNNKFTVFSICKWAEYQELDNSTVNNESTTNQQRINTINRNIRSKEVKEKTKNSTNVLLAPYGKPEINQAFADWQSATGLAITGQVRANRNAASNLLKKHGAEALGKLIKLVAASQEDQYAPRIGDFCGLQAKQNDLLVWAKKSFVKQEKSQMMSV